MYLCTLGMLRRCLSWFLLATAAGAGAAGSAGAFPPVSH